VDCPDSPDPRSTLLERWQRNCLRSAIGNYDAANSYTRQNYCLGIPAILLSAVVGTSVFVALGTQVNPLIQILVGCVSVLATVLGALQTFLKWGELSSKHQAAAAEYNAIKRYIDQVLACHEAGDSIQEIQIEQIRTQMDTLARDAPNLPKSIWVAARSNVPLEQDRDTCDEQVGGDSKNANRD